MLNQAALSTTAFRARQATGTAGSIDMMGTVMSFPRNSEIYGEGEQAEFLYKVVSGTVRTYRVLSDGRRQIGAFHLAGDLFGLEAGDTHAFSAEAVNEAKIIVIKRSAVLSLAAHNTDTASELLKLTTRELLRMQGHVMLLIKSAHERVASFLLDMAARSPSADQFDLPMSRQDIADYLGLTIETVSRTMTSLENAAAIALPSARKVVLRNRAALNQLSN